MATECIRVLFNYQCKAYLSNCKLCSCFSASSVCSSIHTILELYIDFSGVYGSCIIFENMAREIYIYLRLFITETENTIFSQYTEVNML